MRHSAMILLVFLLMGCGTAYQPSSLMSYGFSENQLSENVWRVTFEGNSSTSMNQAYDMATLRAADLTLSRGYVYFVISDSQTGNRVSSQTLPGAMQTTMATPVTGGAPVAVIARGKGMSFSSNYPTSMITVSMYKAKPELASSVYDARFTCQKLGAENSASCGTVK